MRDTVLRCWPRAAGCCDGCTTSIRRFWPSGVSVQPGEVIRHGDFGPNNVLLDSATMTVTALLDWEFSTVGPRIDDLAWCEWIVRTAREFASGRSGRRGL